jgi:hypothetical protein
MGLRQFFATKSDRPDPQRIQGKLENLGMPIATSPPTSDAQ